MAPWPVLREVTLQSVQRTLEGKPGDARDQHRGERGQRGGGVQAQLDVATKQELFGRCADEAVPEVEPVADASEVRERRGRQDPLEPAGWIGGDPDDGRERDGDDAVADGVEPGRDRRQREPDGQDPSDEGEAREGEATAPTERGSPGRGIGAEDGEGTTGGERIGSAEWKDLGRGIAERVVDDDAHEGRDDDEGEAEAKQGLRPGEADGEGPE